MLAPHRIDTPKQLLVEGRDAQEFFKALLGHLQIADVQVQNFGGVNDLRGFLKAFVRMPGFLHVESVGIVRDAEDNPSAAFQSVRDALLHVGLPAPTTVKEVSDNHPRVSILLLPDAQSTGSLETLCLRSVMSDPAMKCVFEYMECVARKAGTLPHPLDKARVQAFLASRERPGLLLGQAAHRGYWDFDSPEMRHVTDFLRNL